MKVTNDSFLYFYLLVFLYLEYVYVCGVGKIFI